MAKSKTVTLTKETSNFQIKKVRTQLPRLPEEVWWKICSNLTDVEDWDNVRSTNKFMYRIVNKVCYGRKVHQWKISVSVTVNLSFVSVQLSGSMQTIVALVQPNFWPHMCQCLWSWCEKLQSIEIWGSEYWSCDWDNMGPYQIPSRSYNSPTTATLKILPSVVCAPIMNTFSGYAVTLGMINELQGTTPRNLTGLHFLPRAPFCEGPNGDQALNQLISSRAGHLKSFVLDDEGTRAEECLALLQENPQLEKLSINLGKFKIDQQIYAPERINLHQLAVTLKGKAIKMLDVVFYTKTMAYEVCQVIEALAPVDEIHLNLPNIHMFELLTEYLNKNRPYEQQFADYIAPSISPFAQNLKVLNLGPGLESIYLDEDLFESFPSLNKITGVQIDHLAGSLPLVLLDIAEPRPKVEILCKPITSVEKEWEFHAFLQSVEQNIIEQVYDPHLEVSLIDEPSRPFETKIVFSKNECKVEISTMLK